MAGAHMQGCGNGAGWAGGRGQMNSAHGRTRGRSPQALLASSLGSRGRMHQARGDYARLPLSNKIIPAVGGDAGGRN